MSNDEQLTLEGMAFGANLPQEPEIVSRSGSSDNFFKRILNEKYERLVKESDRAGLNPNDVFGDSEKKRYFLKSIMEYPQLTGENGQEIPIDYASNARIGKTFQNTYKSAQRALKGI